jgi:hypothetical protein
VESSRSIEGESSAPSKRKRVTCVHRTVVLSRGGGDCVFRVSRASRELWSTLYVTLFRTGALRWTR